jgi:hypothetical protein
MSEPDVETVVAAGKRRNGAFGGQGGGGAAAGGGHGAGAARGGMAVTALRADARAAAGEVADDDARLVNLKRLGLSDVEARNLLGSMW